MSVPRRDVADVPYLSVVVTARNDDHGGDMLRRMQIFLDAWFEQVARHRLRAEMIIVEWNPPPNRPRLVDVLTWPHAAPPGSGRIIIVPPDIHARYRCSDRLGLLQMIAKNVGIRRARGQFILSTNIDLLFSDDLVRFLATEDLDPSCLYRNDRVDVDGGVPLGVPVAQQLKYCREHMLRINTRWGTFAPGERWWWFVARRLFRAAIADPMRPRLRTLMASARQLLQWNPQWTWRLRAPAGWRTRLSALSSLRLRPLSFHRMRRIVRRSAKRVRVGIRHAWVQGMALARVAALFIPAAARRASAVWNDTVTAVRETPGNVRRSFAGIAEAVGATVATMRETAKPLHTNGCGDFTLLANEWWVRLRSYPEWDMFSIHLDSVFCQMAAHAGAREVVLGKRMHTYHIDHGGGWSSGEADRVIQRIQRLGVPFLGISKYRELVKEMRRGPLVFNDENWGLAVERFEEIDPLMERAQRPDPSAMEEARL